MSIEDADLDALRALARVAQPREACGLLLGRREGSRILVVRVVAARNVAAELERFEVDPRDHLEAQRAARETGLEVVGAWHSHAHGPATPSASDAREAVPAWVHVIVDARAGDCRAWYAGDDGLVELVRVG
ncbi:MAG TPA: M67 family metallopeptidase [Planctomycetota bacterium]|nr:M67 family metallopeptidase [Planctomycetota bacterium]